MAGPFIWGPGPSALNLAGGLITNTGMSGSDINNCSIATSVGSNALTITLNTEAGSAPSSASPIIIGFRNNTLTSGVWSFSKATGATTLTVPSGATLGMASGRAGVLTVYALNNAGTINLGVSFVPIAEGGVISSTAITSGSTANNVIYSNSALSNVGFRILGTINIVETTAGTWASNATQVSFVSRCSSFSPIVARYHTGTSHSITSGSTPILNYDTMDVDPYNLVVTGASWTYTCPLAGYYLVAARVLYDPASFSPGTGGWLYLNHNGSNYTALLLTSVNPSPITWQVNLCSTDVIPCSPGDTIQAQGVQNSGGTTTYSNGNHCNISITYLGQW